MLSKLQNNRFEDVSSSSDVINFHGAAIVNSDGREVPITSDMVDQALQQARDFLCPTQTIWSHDNCVSN